MISKPAPFFSGTSVLNGEFKELTLDDFKGKFLVFFFYPLDFPFVCPTEILAFNDRVEEFRKIGAEVVGCSVDSHFTHLAWIKLSSTRTNMEKYVRLDGSLERIPLSRIQR